MYKKADYSWAVELIQIWLSSITQWMLRAAALTGHSAGHWLGVGGDSRGGGEWALDGGWRVGRRKGWVRAGSAVGRHRAVTSSWRASGAGWLRWKSRRATISAGARDHRQPPARHRLDPLSLSLLPPPPPLRHPHQPHIVCATPARSWRVCVYATHTTRHHRLLSLRCRLLPFRPTACDAHHISTKSLKLSKIQCSGYLLAICTLVKVFIINF